MSHEPKATATSGRRSGAGASLRPRRSGLRVSALIGLVLVAGALVLAGGTTGHEGHEHRAPGEAIDPEHAYPYGLIAAGGGHFHALLVTPDLRTLFAGTHIGLFRSQDRGVTWRLVASRFSGDDVHAVAVDGKTGVLYAATHGQGLLASPDQGAHWYDESDALPGRDLHALALEPMTGGVYVWAVGHGVLYRATGTRRWERRAGPDVLAGVESLAVNPGPRRLYAGTASGVWVSDDGGRRWRLPEGGLRARTAGVGVSAHHPDRVFAATFDGVFVGRADGTAWTALGPAPDWWGPLDGFAFVASHPGAIFAVAHDGVVAVRGIDEGPWVPVALDQRLGARHP
jgi:photosystem II stability/assembly factor-like uncharacterized protein